VDAGTRENSAKTPDFETVYKTALCVVANPILLWKNNDVRVKRAVMHYAVTSRLRYERGVRIEPPQSSLPVQLFQILTP
jgi:hypothetical protein